MSDIKNKLEALLANRMVMKGADWQQRLETLRQERESGEHEIDRSVPGTLVGETDRGFHLVSELFPLDACQGAVALGTVLNVTGDHIALSASDDSLAEFNPRNALFIDTETTGLSGGTGTVAFLVGVGYFTDEGFRLDQCFLRDFDDEEPMLEYLGEIFRGKEAVVSYNGKSFDLPLLRTRFIQNRIPFRLDAAMHFDLLHAARRFWKRRLGACNLSNIEREILGIHRHGDVPSYLIPQMWFDYLRTRDARPLSGVFYHHKMDILSLVALTGWLSQCLSQPLGEGFAHAQDKLSLVRIYFTQKRYADVLQHATRLIEDEREPEPRKECMEMVVLASKRLGDYSRMEETLGLLLQEHPSDLQARWELAKYYEHRTRDFLQAEKLCLEAISQLETRIATGAQGMLVTGMLESFNRRLARIRTKMLRSQPGK